MYKQPKINQVSCDQVFEQLTLAPFPTSDETLNLAVESHLRCCHECSSLAEALRPATMALEENLPQAESATLPQFNGEYWKSQPSGHSRGSNSRNLPLRLFAIAASLAILATTTTWILSAPASDFNMAHEESTNFKHETQAKEQLLALEISAHCQPVDAKNTKLNPHLSFVSTNQLEQFQCCSQCHHQEVQQEKAPSKTLPSTTLLAIVDSCRACHTP